MLKNSLPKLPETPGVYIFSQGKKPIYIGKAINLKRRVYSYFDLDLAPKTAQMVTSAETLKFIRVESELEALLLEATLIRKHMPKYNVISKDDKHPLYITITKDKFPRVIMTRRNGNFGPFPSSRNVYSVLKMLRKIFPYSDHKLGKKACFYSHIGLCNPCPNEIVQSTEWGTGSASEVLRKKYLKNIKHVKSILEGRFIKVRNDLEKEMLIASKNQNFETAVDVRDQIQKLDYITKPQMPTDFYIENPNLYEDQRNLEIKELAKIVNIKNLKRIECFDIAHLAGTDPTASMVVFVDGEAEKSEYRHFKIRQKNGQSDYDSMREVAERRLKNMTLWGVPDLIIVDGGLGQVKIFKEVIKDIPIVGIAKHPDRLIVGEEKIKLEDLALNLVQRIRDEAHRFARRYHHHLISKEYKYANHS
ncbi:MAG TPA: UvrB/UvrC motif-containing protein [Alphaproteobacteria bacterium]|jgi:excinuclease ABC subunit C|nr:UvrB/UvrC motif-containing protein [Alphaproteobacteria bacterium]